MIIQGRYHLKSKKWNLNKIFQIKSNASEEMICEYKEIVLDQITQMIREHLLDCFDVKEYNQMNELIPDKISQIQFIRLK
tara:strand:- start:720 stop:959 length:240 start_codon:yes stop_codon:yes gene_type:complete